MKILKEQKKLYYILGKAFMYDEKEYDKNNKNDIKKAPVKTKVKYRAHSNNQDITSQTAPEGDKSHILSENLKTDDLSEKENKEEEKTEAAEEKQVIEEDIMDINIKEEVQEIQEINDIENIEEIKNFESVKENEGVDIMTVSCGTGLDPNCGECCAIFTDPARRTAFGYQIDTAACVCHDICVEDVRDICVHERTLTYCIPCNTDGRAGCRGGFLPDGLPTVQSWRVFCADENLSPATGCDRIINNVEFEVVLRFGSTLVVVTPKDTITCFFNEFARFPSGTFYTNNTAGLNQFRNELAQIDGSCKVIIIENVRVGTNGNDCLLFIDYKIIDKLWKHENLLVSAIKPYIGPGEIDNITVSQEFGQGHLIGPCTDSGPCAGLPVAAASIMQS